MLCFESSPTAPAAPLSPHNLVLQNTIRDHGARHAACDRHRANIDLPSLGRRGFSHRRDRRGAVVGATTSFHFHLHAPIAASRSFADRRVALAIGWPISRFRPSSLPLPACWCFKGLALAVLQAGPVALLADLPETLFRFHSELFPAPARFNPTLRLLIGACWRLVWSMSSSRTRARAASCVEVGPRFFALKNATLFRAVIIYFTYRIASHRGLPHCW